MMSFQTDHNWFFGDPNDTPQQKKAALGAYKKAEHRRRERLEQAERMAREYLKNQQIHVESDLF